MKIVQKGWGYEKWICNSEKYCGKLLFFNAGKKCSYHYHKIKDETFYVQSGELKMTYGYRDDFIDADTIHFFQNGVLDNGSSALFNETLTRVTTAPTVNIPLQE